MTRTGTTANPRRAGFRESAVELICDCRRRHPGPPVRFRRRSLRSRRQPTPMSPVNSNSKHGKLTPLNKVCSKR